MTEPIDLYERITTIHKRTVSLTWLAALTGLLALSGCESGTNSGMGTVRLYLAASGTSTMLNTAAMLDFADVTAARVTITDAELMPGHVSVLESPITVDLLDMQGNATALLGAASTLGDYEQLRLVVTDPELEVNGDPLPLRVPSGAQTGIKVNFSGPIEVGPGATVDLAAVFEVDESFVFQGPPDNPRSASFKPVIHASTIEAASITGTLEVTLAVAQAGDSTLPVTVKASLNGDDMSTTTVAVLIPAGETSVTVPYALGFLQPGSTYTVSASATDYDATPTEETVADVSSGANTGPDFSLSPSP